MKLMNFLKKFTHFTTSLFLFFSFWIVSWEWIIEVVTLVMLIKEGISPKSCMSQTIRFQAQNLRFVLLCLRNKHLKQILVTIRFIHSKNIYWASTYVPDTKLYSLNSCVLSAVSFVNSWTSWVWMWLIDALWDFCLFFIFL